MKQSSRIRFITFIISYFAMQFIRSNILYYFMDDYTATFWTSGILFVVVIVLFHQFLKGESQRFFQQFEGWPAFILKSLGMYIVISLVRSFVLMPLVANFGGGTLVQSGISSSDLLDIFPIFPLLQIFSIFGFIINELVFREGLLGWVDKNNKILLVVMTLLSIILFSYIDTPIPQMFILSVPLALVLSYYYFAYDRNVMGPILFHLIYFVTQSLFFLVQWILL